MTIHDSKTAAADGEAAPMPLPFTEFVALIAVMMALTALSIDIMLPALPDIGAAMGVASENDRQLVVIIYVLGFALGQIVYGPLSDRYGRRPVLLAGFAIYIAASFAAIWAGSFTALLVARALQGVGAASPRVMALAIVRDVTSGRRMARIMSLAMALFIIIPVFAPAMGQGLMALGSWRTPFDLLLVFALVTALWIAMRLPETSAVGRGGALPQPLIQSVRAVVGNRQTVAYTAAAGFLFGSLLGYVASCQQIFVDVYGLGAWFPLAFGAIASTMALAAWVNSRLVEQLGMRLVSHVSLAGFIAASLVLLLAARADALPLWLFALLMALCFFLFGLIQPNFNALAMEPQGRNAGMASSLIGFYSTAAGALIAALIGHLFDGSAVPLATGYAATGLLSAAAVVLAEGRAGLFGRNRL
jgi:DHA1 family bicyclomycin/chloramphenicol resistance-like MFS transporter